MNKKKTIILSRNINPRTRRILIMSCGPGEQDENIIPPELRNNVKNCNQLLPSEHNGTREGLTNPKDVAASPINTNELIKETSGEEPSFECLNESENQNSVDISNSISRDSDSNEVTVNSVKDKSGHYLRPLKNQNCIIEDSDEGEDFSPDVSEYLPSPEREDSLFGELINENMKTPSAISNISNFFSNMDGSALPSPLIQVNSDNVTPRQMKNINSDTLESPKTFLDLDTQEQNMVTIQEIPTSSSIHDLSTPLVEEESSIDDLSTPLVEEESSIDDLSTPLVEEENRRIILEEQDSNTTKDTNQTVLSNLSIENNQLSTDQLSSNQTTKTLTRKRQINTKDWQDVKNKRLKNAGEAYLSVRQKISRPAKSIGDVCSCKKKCYENITQEQRTIIFNQFWNIGDHERQWHYILRYVSSQDIKRMSFNRKNNRTQTLMYKFPVNDGLVTVCKKFFLNTLSICDRFVYTALEKGKAGPNITDNRGIHDNRPRKMSEDTEKSIIAHINLFPVKESHYVRKETKRLYLHEDVKSIRNMYRLYKEWFINFTKENPGVKDATRRQYETIFNTRYNYSFFKPKKDMCSTCALYNEADEERKKTLEENYQAHILRKEYIRDIKRKEKEQADPMTTTVATFDLEKVLNIPQSNVGVFHYKRKYPIYDFTIHKSLTKKGYCYVWHLQIAKRGAIEIGSCLLDFIHQEHTQGITCFSFYSDSCPGQNKNRFIFALYLYVSKKFKINLTHRFFEVGHSQSEVDSMHSCIERAKNNKIIYNPDQMYGIIMNAKTEGEKYTLKEMQQADFLNIKQLVDGKNWDRDVNNAKVKWSHVKEVSVMSTKPDQLMFKYDFAEDCLILNTEIASRPSRGSSARLPRGRISATNNSVSSNLDNEEAAGSGLQTLKPAYSQPIPVPKALYNDLMSLCRSEAIPRHYQEFYKSLSCDNNIEEIDSNEEEA